MRRITILFLGPCRKLDAATSKPFPPFSPASRSGKFLRSAIEAATIPAGIDILFDNIIPRPVFDKSGKERNPNCAELVTELTNHSLWNLRERDIVVGLSAVVGEALQKVQAGRARSHVGCGPTVLRFEHPSFMMRRPAEERSEYVRRLGDGIQRATALI